MERKAIVLCCIVAFCGILSAVSGFAAEATRIKISQVKFVTSTRCSYPRSPALAFGLTAAAALLAAHVILNCATGCICCKRRDQTWNANWTKTIIFYVFSWLTFIIAFLILLTGSALNDHHGEGSVYFGKNYYCYVVKPGVFAGGAILGVASITLGIFYYLSLNMRKNETATFGNVPIPNQGGIAVGEPEFPPQSSQGSLYVHK